MSASIRPEPKAGYDLLVDPQCEAVVVHCSDPRFQLAFREFTSRHLGLRVGDFMPLVASGGASVLAHPLRLPKEFKFMRDRLEFYRSVMPSLKRVVLISHQSCRYSRSLRARVVGARVGCEEEGPADLRVVRTALQPTLAQLELAAELYCARFAGPSAQKVIFERVE